MSATIEQINRLGYAFVEFALPMLIQSGVLILILLLVDLLLRKKVRAVFRYWIWMLVLVKLLLPTSLSSPVSLGRWFGDELAYVDMTAAPKVDIAPKPAVEAPPVMDIRRVETTTRAPAVVPVEPTARHFEPAATEPISPPSPAATSLSWQGAALLSWLAVIVAMVPLLLQRALFVRRLVGQAGKANRPMTEALGHCCQRMAVKRRIDLRISASATSPAVCGLSNPVILVPKNLTPSLSSGELRVVLLHELAHIKRGDLWVNLAQTILQIFYFYNPLLWLANAMTRRAREQAVDEMVLVAMGENARQYPETLVNVAKLAFKRPALSLRLIGVVESKSVLTGRIKHILNRPMPKTARLGILSFLVVIVIAAILLPMAISTPGPPELIIKGIVRDAQTGKPIAGARVFDDGYGPMPSWDQIRPDERSEWGAITNTAGEYSFLTWPEHHSVSVEVPGYKSKRESLYDGHFTSNRKDEEIIDFVLEPEGISESSEFKKTSPNGKMVEPAIGGWEDLGEAIPPDFNDTMMLAEHVNLGSIGQDSEGKVFITCIRDAGQAKSRRYRFLLEDMDGTILEPSGYTTFGPKDQLHEKFSFDAPFLRRQIREFRFQGGPLPLAGVDDVSSQLQKGTSAALEEKTLSPSKLAPPGRYAMELDGVDDYLLVPDSPSLRLEPPFTVEMWVKTKLPVDASEDHGGWAVISKGFHVGTPRARVTGFGVTLQRSPEEQSDLYVDFSKGNNSGIYDATYGTYPLRNGNSDWIHLTHVFDGENYKSAPGHPLVMGRFVIPTTRPLMGLIGEIRIWNGKRTRQEIRKYEKVALTGEELDLAAWWTFEQTEGQFAYDMSGNNNHARLGASEGADEADPNWVDLVQGEERLFSVYGTVTDQSGRPMADVQLTADCGHGKLERTGRAVTDKNGRYELSLTSSVKNVGADPYDVGIQTARIEARAKGFYEANICRDGNLAMAGKPPGPDEQRFVADYAGVVLPHKPYELNLVMHPAARIEGELVDEQGKPIRRRGVWLHGDGLLKNTSLGGSANQDGRFTIDHVPCGSVWFQSVNGQLVESGVVTLPRPGVYRALLQFGKSPTGLPTLRIAEFQSPASNVTGPARPRVVDPNGNPVAGAQVALCTKDKGVVIRAGKLGSNRMGGRTTTILETDADGLFDFSDWPDVFHVIAAHEKGFAWITSEQLASSPEIRLQSWGRIEGHLYIGRKSGADEKVSLLNYINKNAIDQGIRFEYEAHTDAGGKFAFDKVPPGWLEIGYLTRMGDSSWSQTGRTPVQIHPGVTLTIAIGGRGRPVVGKFVPPPGFGKPVYFGEGLRALDTVRPARPKPEDYDRMSKRQQQEWYNQWRKTPEAETYYDTMWRDPGRRHYVFRIEKDGSFRIEDVIAGEYNLTVWIEERLKGEGRPEEIAGYYGTIEVPEMSGGRSDEPLDLGELELSMHEPVRVGDVAPLFEGRTLDGKDLQLVDYRGRFVLLSFWQPVFHPERQQLQELHDTYNPDGRLEIIGLGGHDTLEEVKKYVQDNSIPWPQIHTGEEFRSGVAKDYGLPGTPCIFLVGPDGMIVAKGLRGEKLKTAVRQALGAPRASRVETLSKTKAPPPPFSRAKVTDIRLPFTFTIYTLTPDNRPQPGVKVRCLHPRPERAEPIVDMVVESDENGVAKFTITQADLLTDWMYWFSLDDKDYVGSPGVGITPDEGDWTFKVALPITR